MKKSFNKVLRSSVLINSIRAEEISTKIIKSLLRTIKGDSKLLSNKSSSLSFKNKIDMLYDLEDVSKNEYSGMLKFMEIRNQFIHNPECDSFLDLKKEKPDIITYLKKNYKNELEVEETSLQKSYVKLTKKVIGKLGVLLIEYNKGQTKEFVQFVKSQALDNFDAVFDRAIDYWVNGKQSSDASSQLAPTLSFEFKSSEELLRSFKSLLEISILDEEIQISSDVAEGKISDEDIFKRRVDIIKEYNKNKGT